MSFILDALRKSEHERQRQAAPDFAHFQTAAPRSRHPVWIFGVGALLIVNLIAVLILVLRGERQTTETDPPPSQTALAPQTAAPPSAAMAAQGAQVPAESVATAQPPLPISAPTPHPASAIPPPSAPAEPASPPEPKLREIPAPAQDEVLPTIHQLNLQGVNALPELHLDIHVYSTRAADRFVFINMRKYKEGAQTQEGILVERITPDGAVLNRNGTRFLLPRQ